MKKLAFLFMLSSIVGQAQTINNSIEIGDYREGGIVFYIDDSGEHGLVCALEDQSSATTWAKRRSVRKNERLSENFHTSKTIFGNKWDRKKTKINKNAKKLSKNLKIKAENKTYSDNYLPSKEDLLKLYENLEIINEAALKNNGQKFQNSIYWSSTEYDYTNAMVVNFKDGKEGHYYKNYLYNVRAIRSF